MSEIDDLYLAEDGFGLAAAARGGCVSASELLEAALARAASVLNDVAEIDPHAELDAAIGRHISVSLCHLALHFDGATHRVNHAGEVKEQAVASSLNNSTAMFLALAWAGDKLGVRVAVRES